MGLNLKDGSILSIYSHWDNYPSWAGRILCTHYNTREKVEALVDGGDVSCLWTDKVWGENRKDGQKYGPETYAARGEDCPPRLDNDQEEFFSDGEEFSYIFRNGNWFAYDMHQFEDNVAPEPVEIPKGALAC